MCKKGFTLIELLVVIAIIAILAAILFPVFIQAKEKARQVQCFGNMKQIGTAYFLYLQDSNDTFPPVWYEYCFVSNPMVNNAEPPWCPKTLPAALDKYGLRNHVSRTLDYNEYETGDWSTINKVWVCPTVKSVGWRLKAWEKYAFTYLENPALSALWLNKYYGWGDSSVRAGYYLDLPWQQVCAIRMSQVTQRISKVAVVADMNRYWLTYGTASEDIDEGLHNRGGNILLLDGHAKYKPYPYGWPPILRNGDVDIPKYGYTFDAVR